MPKKPKKTFIFYNDWKDYVDQMNREEAGIFLKAILSYQNGDPPDLDWWIKFIRGRIKKQLDEDNKKREEEVEKRRNAGRKWGLTRASNAKQNKAGAWNSRQVLRKNKKIKQIQADNDNVNENDNERNNTSITEAKASETTNKGNTEINNLVKVLKETAENLWIAYDKTRDRQFGRHICTAIEFGSFAEKIGQNRVEFAKNVMIASLKIWYWKGACAWPKAIYQEYSAVFNEAQKKSKKNEIPEF